MPPKTRDKSDSLYITFNARDSDKLWKWHYLSVQSSYLKISTTKHDDPYIHEVRTIIKKAFKYDRADPCKIKIEFNKKLKPIFLKASSEEEAKKWIDALMWEHNGPPTEMQPTDDPPPYESIQSHVQAQHRDKLHLLSSVCSII